MYPKINAYFVICLILFSMFPVQADAPIRYNKELASDVELRGTFFTNDNADGFYVSLIGENSIRIDSDIHYVDKTIKVKKTALDSRFKKFNGINIGITHISDDGIVNNYISLVVVDGEFVYITVDFSTVIINGMTGTTTITLNELSGNQSISVPDGSSYDFNITNNQLDLVNATGGVLTTNETDNIHTFTTSGTFTPDNNFNVSYLIIAGGGGGGSRGGGGGAGGLKISNSHAVTPQAYTITVGTGGASSVLAGPGGSGSNSVFDSITSTGGGGGAGWDGDAPLVGGSGGGGSAYGTTSRPGAAGTGSEGFAGGDGGPNDAYDSGGGGGGASEVGKDFVTGTAGDGGDGIASSITGSSITYAGGGGGGGLSGTPGSGGNGGGGGGSTSGNGIAGTENTGGGGGSAEASPASSGAGGSGIVIIRYNTPQAEGTVNITASVTGDSNTQNYNTSQSREFTLTPTGTTNNVLINTSSTDYDVTVTTYWTENTTLQSETAAAGYAKQYINYTPSFNVTSADLNTTFTFDFSAQDYIGTATSTLNDVSKTTTRDGQEVNASVGSLTESVPYWWNVTIPYNNVPTVGTIANTTAYLGIEKSFTAPSYSDLEGLSIDTHYWQFGDGNTSSDQNPTHTYTSIDTFSANYTVTETATVSPQAVLRVFTMDVEVQPPQNVTTIPHQTNVSINWDDYAYADKYSVYELEDGFPYVDTNPTVDGIKDAIYDYAHEFLIFSPNPVNPGDYETSYPIRTALGAYFFHEAVDNDDKSGDDDLIYYWDLDNNGLTVDDPAWKITDNVVKKYLWDGDSWQVTGSTNAIGDSTGGGTHYPKHELFIPIAELGANWTNGSTVKVLVKREDSSLSPDVVTWYPYGNINDTDTSLWQDMVLNDPESYILLDNTTNLWYNATGLTPFTIYHGAVSSWNGSHESSYTLFDVITQDIPVYNVSGYVFDDLGNTIAGATVWSQNGFVGEITTSDANGYYIGYNFRVGNYSIYANKTGYAQNFTDVYVTGNLTNINVTLPAYEMTDWMLWEKLLEIEDLVTPNSTVPETTPPENAMPLPLFIAWTLILIGLVYVAYPTRDEDEDAEIGIKNITAALMSVILAFTLSKISINGQLVQTFSGMSAINTVVIDTIPMRIGWLSWVFAFIGVGMVMFTILLLITEYKNRYGEITDE